MHFHPAVLFVFYTLFSVSCAIPSLVNVSKTPYNATRVARPIFHGEPIACSTELHLQISFEPSPDARLMPQSQANWLDLLANDLGHNGEYLKRTEEIDQPDEDIWVYIGPYSKLLYVRKRDAGACLRALRQQLRSWGVHEILEVDFWIEKQRTLEHEEWSMAAKGALLKGKVYPKKHGIASAETFRMRR